MKVNMNILPLGAFLLPPILVAFVVGAGLTAALAQKNFPEAKLTSNPVAGMPEAAPLAQATSPPQAIGSEQAVYLVRSALLTLNDANRSGNYTVLRDLASPGFQVNNTAADLTQSFADLRRRNFDLFAAAILAPQFTSPPTIAASGGLHLTGFFPTRPLQISFDLTFQAVGGQWRLFSISVTTPEAPKTQSQIIAPPRRFPSRLLDGAQVSPGSLGWRW